MMIRATLAVLLLVSTTLAQPTTAPYMQAADLMRKLSEGPDSTLIDRDAPLNDRTAKFLAQQQPIFDLLHEAAQEDNPEWAKSTDDMDAMLHALNPMRGLANLGVLHARLLLEQDEASKAVDQLLDVIAMARNIDRSNPLMVSSLVSIGIEELAMSELAQSLPALPRDVVATLPDRLKQLPAPAKFSELISGEQKFGGALLAQQLKAPQAAKAFDAMSPFYDAIKKASDEKPDISNEALKKKLTDAVSTIDANQSVSRAMAQNMVPSFAAFYSTWCIRQEHRAMLDAGVQIVLNGPDAVQSSKDPFADNPFKFTRMSDGFELSGSVQDRKSKPVSMRFGK